jgi:hypothetical protein
MEVIKADGCGRFQRVTATPGTDTSSDFYVDVTNTYSAAIRLRGLESTDWWSMCSGECIIGLRGSARLKEPSNRPTTKIYVEWAPVGPYKLLRYPK